MNARTIFLASGACIVLAVLSGCVSGDPIDAGIVGRYQRAMAARGPQRRLEGEELGLLRPAPAQAGPQLEVVKDPQTGKARVLLSIDEAVLLALANNLDIRVVSFDPAVSREAVIQAAAEFDAVVFGEYSYQDDDDRVDPALGGGMVNTRTYQAGIRQKIVTGAEWSLAGSATRAWDDAVARTFSTRWTSEVEFRITQPLLRNGWFGPDLANLRIASVNRKISMAAFHQQVEQIIVEVISTYWAVVQVRRELAIQQVLLDKTQETLRRLKSRAELDVTSVEIKQVEAAVEVRRAGLFRARKTILDVEQALARLLAGSQLNVLSDYEIVPQTPAVVLPVVIEPNDQMLAALRHNPRLQQARLAIEASRIAVRLAKNQRLPRLDVAGSVGLQGMDAGLKDSIDQLNTGGYFSYGFGLVFEYPLGNRSAAAGLRSARFAQARSIVTMQNTADQIAVEIGERIRQIRTSFLELQAQRAAVEAATAQLDALEETERIRGRLTPEFLQVKLSAQETLANAQRSQARAIMDYNTALVDLSRATGTVLQLNRVQLALPGVLDEQQAPQRQTRVKE